MTPIQKGILLPLPAHARYLFFDMLPGTDPRESLLALKRLVDGEKTVIGFGQSLVLALGRTISGLHVFPRFAGKGFEVPSTPAVLCCWLRGDDRGDLVRRGRSLVHATASAFRLDHVVDAFRYDRGLDLTGYEDGTENPKDNAAVEAGFVSDRGPGLDGSSFVAIQQWIHDLDYFESMAPEDQDNSIGRRKSDNVELVDAPASSHVKRTAQESFTPTAFLLRRSLPWADEHNQGLLFVAFGKSFDAFEAQLRRMVGAENGIADDLFRFTRPVSGCYFWCPPMKADQPDLSLLGL
jgi:porphyrinogen peroxidase